MATKSAAPTVSTSEITPPVQPGNIQPRTDIGIGIGRVGQAFVQRPHGLWHLHIDQPVADIGAVLRGDFGRIVLHGCHIGRNAMVRMNAVVMDGAVIGENAIIAAVALVKAGATVPPNVLLVGSPSRIVRELSPATAPTAPDPDRHRPGL